MKKALSIILAVMMIFAVMVPAFAVDEVTTVTINQATPDHKGTAIIKTDGKTEGGGDARTWEVSYPAETTFAWNTKVADAKITYKAVTHLGYNDQLKISVAPLDGNAVMAFVDDSTVAGLNYTLKELDADTQEYVALKDGMAGARVDDFAKDFYVDIANWDTAYVGAYQGTLTFTAEIVEA